MPRKPTSVFPNMLNYSFNLKMMMLFFVSTFIKLFIHSFKSYLESKSTRGFGLRSTVYSKGPIFKRVTVVLVSTFCFEKETLKENTPLSTALTLVLEAAPAPCALGQLDFSLPPQPSRGGTPPPLSPDGSRAHNTPVSQSLKCLCCYIYVCL